MTNLSRRGLLGALICAPAIVRASSLMPIKVWDDPFAMDLNEAALERVFNSANWGDLLRPGLINWHGRYAKIPEQWAAVFDQQQRDMAALSGVPDVMRGAA